MQIQQIRMTEVQHPRCPAKNHNTFTPPHLIAPQRHLTHHRCLLHRSRSTTVSPKVRCRSRLFHGLPHSASSIRQKLLAMYMDFDFSDFPSRWHDSISHPLLHRMGVSNGHAGRHVYSQVEVCLAYPEHSGIWAFMNGRGKDSPPHLTPLTFLTAKSSSPSTKSVTIFSIAAWVFLSIPASNNSSMATFDKERPCWRMKNDTAMPPRGSRKCQPPKEEPRMEVSATSEVRASARWLHSIRKLRCSVQQTRQLTAKRWPSIPDYAPRKRPLLLIDIAIPW